MIEEAEVDLKDRYANCWLLEMFKKDAKCEITNFSKIFKAAETQALEQNLNKLVFVAWAKGLFIQGYLGPLKHSLNNAQRVGYSVITLFLRNPGLHLSGP